MSDNQTASDPFSMLLEAQKRMNEDFFGKLVPGMGPMMPEEGEMTEWAANAGKLQEMWRGFLKQSGLGDFDLADTNYPAMPDPGQWFDMMEGWLKQLPFADIEAQKKLWQDSTQLWQSVFAQYAVPGSPAAPQELPRKDRRFADPRWQEQPAFALIHQTYLMLSDYIEQSLDKLEGVPEEKREQMHFACKAMIDALSPANFPTINPVVLDKVVETRGENLVKGMKHLMADVQRGQLTHTDPDAFELGRNIAVTPGKVVLETPLYQLIQYSPTTDKVLGTPLIIFPPWINRFYILDLNPKKSFIRWAVEQGLTVFVVSWKSADASMKDVVWDDYIRGQIEAIDHVRERLDVPAVHTIGYCVAGTTLAATLAILAERDEADKVASSTFFTAQVDFERAGELLNFIDDAQLKVVDHVATDGYLDGRIMAATFNLLRSNDLIWSYVVNNYLLGEDYPAFDLLHWNGDVTNLPARWHREYLRDLYRDNKLVQPGTMSADGTPIDLTKVETPTYVQAGKEDHIAPAQSVWKITEHFKGPLRFVLAGSGHIAGVVNPPEAGKYQYWINEDDDISSLEEFRESATEYPGSWWPDWIDWIHQQDSETVPVKGKRKPGGRGDKVIEDAPGRYVMTR